MDNVTRNRLHIASVNRSLANSVITCEASNTDLSLPLHASVQLDMVLAPTSVNIMVSTDIVSLGHQTLLTCQVSGARPEPRIVWQGQDILRHMDTSYQV